ncbi:M56 family metallopeptidase [Paenibacillus ehimensis]|uniref:M56 family metallopeptidase n=1 Tax=Paenibacillus ehimensis TaxID=79264 RepID=UPI000FD8E2BD|nr:M56 family metallopeptidase [Paenibacillus ehimensis]
MAIVLSLIIASVVGTIIWMVQNIIKPVTQKVFSQTWHYYTGLVPLFFLLGGSELINKLVPFMRSVWPDTGITPRPTTMAGQDVLIPIEQTAASSSLGMRQLFVDLLLLDNSKEFGLFATAIWAVGAALFFVVHLQKYRAFKRSVLKESRICDTVPCSVKVIVSAKAATPMAMGLWKPMIVLPDTRLEEKELAMILSHELVHIKRGDLLVKLLMLIANAVHWFNPAVYSLNKQINTLCELSCDEKVVQDMDMENRRFYGETLLSMLEFGVRQRSVVFTSHLCNPKKEMKRRLLSLMNVRKTNKSLIMLSLAATIAMFGSGGFAAYAARSAVPSKIPTDTQVPEGRNIYVQSPDGTVVYYDQDGNVSEVPNPKIKSAPKLTTEELVDQIKHFIENDVPIPQDDVDKLPQQDLDAINKTYSLALQSTRQLTTEELVDRITKLIEENKPVPQAYVNAVPQKELDTINKTYGWELQRLEY